MENNALIRRTEQAVTPISSPPLRVDTSSIGLMELAKALSGSGYFKDTRDASQAVVKVLYGQELGIPPVSAMMGIHIIEGKPAPSANLLAAIIKRSPVYDYRVLERTNERCEILFLERGEELGRAEFTIQDAGRAGLAGKNIWKSYPRAMLFNRAMTEGIRAYCPDLFGGAPVYTAEELGAEVDAEGNPIQSRYPEPTTDARARAEASMERNAKPSLQIAGQSEVLPPEVPDMGALELQTLQGEFATAYQHVMGRGINTRDEKLELKTFVAEALGISENGFKWQERTAADYRRCLERLAAIDSQQQPQPLAEEDPFASEC